VYNVEKYLPRCVDSILAQTFIDFECILIDDGSPDNCGTMCDEYAKIDERIKVIHQKNAGTAHARDAGIKFAKGEFLSFVDADDWIEINALEVLYNKQQETNADIVQGSIKNVYVNYDFIFKQPNIIYDIIPLEYFFSTPRPTNKSLWARIYRRTLYSNLYVPNAKMGQDFMVNVQVFSRVGKNKIVNVDEVVYVYDHRTSGVTKRQTFDEPYYENKSIACRLWIKDFFEKNNFYSGKIKDGFLFDLINDSILSYVRHKKNVTKKEINIFYKEYYCQCNKINEIRFLERVIIPIYKKSLFWGNFYVNLFNFFTNIRLMLKGIK
jgi:glycosyltransferase involved in cell wall biosynthesis